MRLYKDVTVGLFKKFKEYEAHHITRMENKEVNVLSELALGGIQEHLARVYQIEVVEWKSTESFVVYRIHTPPLCASVSHVAALAG